MKKIMSIILVFVMMLSLVACGKSHNTQISGSEDFHGEGQVQGEIKSDDEIAALQEEERAGTTDAQPDTEATTEQSTESDATPATSGTGNAEDYWNGNDYFDLIGYLTDNGYKGFYTYDSNYEPVGDNQSVSLYECYSADFMWMIVIGQGFVSVRYTGGNPSNPVNTPSYIGYTSVAGDQKIQIDNRGSSFLSKTLDALFIVVQNITADSTNTDPMRNTGINYLQY